MKFAVVELGYDPEQVDACVAELGEQVACLSAQAQVATDTKAELALLHEEVTRLRGLLSGRPAVYRTSGRLQRLIAEAEEEAAEIVAAARAELAAAQEEARQVRERVYAEALRARRDFEIALHARRGRERQADEILRRAALGADATSGSAPPAAGDVPVSPAVGGSTAEPLEASVAPATSRHPSRRRKRGWRAVAGG